MVSPRSSLIVTDEPLSPETGKGTDFVVLLSGEPQGGIKSRRRTPGTEFRYARPRASLLAHAFRRSVLALVIGGIEHSVDGTFNQGSGKRRMSAIGKLYLKSPFSLMTENSRWCFSLAARSTYAATGRWGHAA